MIKPPTITSFTPTSGRVGVTLVAIFGTNLSSVTEVRFGNLGITNSITVVSATAIRVTVPAGAVTGKITVINRASPQGVLSIGTFTVLQ